MRLNCLEWDAYRGKTEKDPTAPMPRDHLCRRKIRRAVLGAKAVPVKIGRSQLIQNHYPIDVAPIGGFPATVAALQPDKPQAIAKGVIQRL